MGLSQQLSSQWHEAYEGPGASRARCGPYHAGLLGADALIVLDQAHLVPPFAHLLRAIEGEASLWPKDRTLLPRFIVLPLSATQRERPVEENGAKPFGLEEEDWRAFDDRAASAEGKTLRPSISPPAASFLN
jgi:CRISPR-associated endonuclease/helicase Cas3